MSIQAGGDHYKSLAIEPVEFAMRNDWDCCAFAILKHVTRHRMKAGRLDVEKAVHYIALREHLLTQFNMSRVPLWDKIKMADYTEKNRLGETETRILLALETWVSNDGVRKDALEIMHRDLELLTLEYDIKS